MCQRLMILIACFLLIQKQEAMGQSPPPHPTLTAPIDWQYGKTLAECNKYMLDHQLATDIGFQVGPRGQARSLVRAHRYVLISRSAVFTRLLQQNNAIDKDLLPAPSVDQRNLSLISGHPMQTIDIPDMDPVVFKQLLNYIYTDNATLDLHNVLPLMYAAKNYQLPALINLCQQVLQQNISVDNVCIILNQAIYFNEEQLINKSLEFIGRNAHAIFDSAGFLELSNKALKALISYDQLDINEKFLFQSCMRWVKAQMIAKNLTFEMDSDGLIARRILGDALYNIRFPILEQKEFADLVGTSDLLTCDEKADVYYFIATENHRNGSLSFDCKKRTRKTATKKSRLLERYNYAYQQDWGCGPTVEKIQLSVSRSIVLRSVGSYSIVNPNYRHHYNQQVQPTIVAMSVSINRSNSGYGSGSPEIKVGGTESFTFQASNSDRTSVVEIPLCKPIELEPGYFYIISIKVTNLPTNYCYAAYGLNGRSSFTQEDGITFTFNQAGTSTSQNQGQIPRLYYDVYV